MIDLHCHILPGVDDGAASLGEALAMARVAVASGITHIVATPHVHPGLFSNDLDSIQQAVTSFQQTLDSAQIPLRVAAGAEVRISQEILSMLEDDRLLFVGEMDGMRVLLLEFSHQHILPGAINMVEYLLKRDIRPMIAHPERNGEVVRALNRLQPFVDMGCTIQVTASSLVGNFGPEVQMRAVEMLELGWVDVLASDAHDVAFRPPDLTGGYQVAERVVGQKRAKQMVLDYPEELTRVHFQESGI